MPTSVHGVDREVELFDSEFESNSDIAYLGVYWCTTSVHCKLVIEEVSLNQPLDQSIREFLF